MDHDHDGAYKLLFSQPRLVADLLAGFMREPWVEQADLGTLEKVNPTYVGDDLLPLVLYNGERSWRAAREIGALVTKVPGGLASYRPRLRYLLLEEQRLASADPTVPNLAAALFELERCREPEEIRTMVARLLEWLPAPQARELRRAFATWLRRVLLPDRLPQAAVAEVADLAEVKTMLEQNMIAWRQRVVREADEIRREADKILRETDKVRRETDRIRRETDQIRRETDRLHRKGLREGEEARREGQATLLLRQLESRFGELPSAARRRVETAGSDQLLAWGERLLEAQRLEDVFAS